MVEVDTAVVHNVGMVATHYNYTEYLVMVVNRRVDKVYGTRSTQSVVDFKFGEVDVRYRSTIEGLRYVQLCESIVRYNYY